MNSKKETKDFSDRLIHYHTCLKNKKPQKNVECIEKGIKKDFSQFFTGMFGALGVKNLLSEYYEKISELDKNRIAIEFDEGSLIPVDCALIFEFRKTKIISYALLTDFVDTKDIIIMDLFKMWSSLSLSGSWLRRTDIQEGRKKANVLAINPVNRFGDFINKYNELSKKFENKVSYLEPIKDISENEYRLGLCELLLGKGGV